MATVSLDKRIETASISLQKAATSATTDLGDVSAQVTLEVDYSGSMGRLYRDGVVQECVERALALSLTGLDEDGTVPVTFYDDKVYDPIEVTVANYSGVVDEFTRTHSMGATNYAGPISQALAVTQPARRRLGLKSPKPSVHEADLAPNLHIFVTDGAPHDKERTERLLVEARDRPHFFQFVCLGNDASAIAYLDHLNNKLTGPGVDNVGVTVYRAPGVLSDDEFFADICSEFFPIWLPAARAAGITRR